MSAHNDGLPEDDAGMNLMLHALVDGELDAAAALAVERRIAADPAWRPNMPASSPCKGL